MFNFKSNLRDVWRDDVYNFIMPKMLEYKHYRIIISEILIIKYQSKTLKNTKI